ncbi:MAG: preprotein translocase subunit SecE [Bacillota bacterium]|nr:preprotein translocase subunit SecE [Bacillota bacterium]
MAEAAKKKGNIFRSIGKSFKDIKIELKKVTWPTRKQAVRNTVVVLVFLVIIGLIVFGFDVLFTWITKLFIIK